MNLENWQRVEALLNAALELEPAARREFLDEIGGDGVRSEVESLLAYDRKLPAFWPPPPSLFRSIFLMKRMTRIRLSAKG